MSPTFYARESIISYHVFTIALSSHTNGFYTLLSRSHDHCRDPASGRKEGCIGQLGNKLNARSASVRGGAPAARTGKLHQVQPRH